VVLIRINVITIRRRFRRACAACVSRSTPLAFAQRSITSSSHRRCSWSTLSPLSFALAFYVIRSQACRTLSRFGPQSRKSSSSLRSLPLMPTLGPPLQLLGALLQFLGLLHLALLLDAPEQHVGELRRVDGSFELEPLDDKA
jgi:hypothetical protein